MTEGKVSLEDRQPDRAWLPQKGTFVSKKTVDRDGGSPRSDEPGSAL